MSKYFNALKEAGIEVVGKDVMFLSEAAELKVTDETLNGMFKFITDKYNSLDFAEIEKTAGDYRKFKYRNMIYENATTLRNIYAASTDPGAAKYLEVVDSVIAISTFLERNAQEISELYKSGNGVIQLLYTSLVAAMLYCIGTLVANTIRFVTTEQDTDCQVLFDEIPGSIKHIHIKNVLTAANDIPKFQQLINQFYSANKKPTRAVNESVTMSAGAIAFIATAGVFMLIPAIVNLIREIIYSIYYSRVKMSDNLQLQIDLINTNIESLEARGTTKQNKKIVARQRRIVDKLQKWQKAVSLKLDTTPVAMKRQKDVENKQLKLDRNNPLVQSPDNIPADLLI